jgi:hypothetical protein
MSAELDTIRTGEHAGTARMVFGGELPWHRDRVQLTPDEQRRFDRVAKLIDGPLEKRPYYVPEHGRRRTADVLPYAAGLVNHTGRWALLLGNTAIRTVCANTLGMAERETATGTPVNRWVSVDHRNGAKARLVEAVAQLFGGMVARFEVLARQYRLLKGAPPTEDEFGRTGGRRVAPAAPGERAGATKSRCLRGSFRSATGTAHRPCSRPRRWSPAAGKEESCSTASRSTGCRQNRP